MVTAIATFVKAVRHQRFDRVVAAMGNKRRRIEIFGFLGTGALLGVLLALASELSGHPWWALLMLLLGATGPSVLYFIADLSEQSSEGLIMKMRGKLMSRSVQLKTGLVLLVIFATFAAMWVSQINPRDYGYVPLLPPVILAGAFLGFGYAVLAIVVSTGAADYFFSLPVYDFRMTEMEDLVGLVVFAVVGACLAWGMRYFLLGPIDSP